MNIQVFKNNIEQITGTTKQNKIAEILHVSESKISKWFSGTLQPTLDDLIRISNGYHCSIDWLIGNEQQNTSNLFRLFAIVQDRIGKYQGKNNIY